MISEFVLYFAPFSLRCRFRVSVFFYVDNLSTFSDLLSNGIKMVDDEKNTDGTKN